MFVVGILNIGFFEDFKESDTVLLCGDERAMQLLVEVLSGLATGAMNEVRFEQLPFVKAYRSVSVLARNVRRSRGIRYADPSIHWTRPWTMAQPKGRPAFAWDLSADDWDDVREKVLPLLRGGHQYLGGPDVEVVISGNEYPDWWWGRARVARSGRP